VVEEEKAKKCAKGREKIEREGGHEFLDECKDAVDKKKGEKSFPPQVKKGSSKSLGVPSRY